MGVVDGGGGGGARLGTWPTAQGEGPQNMCPRAQGAAARRSTPPRAAHLELHQVLLAAAAACRALVQDGCRLHLLIQPAREGVTKRTACDSHHRVMGCAAGRTQHARMAHTQHDS
jgi:hypothetical protein